MSFSWEKYEKRNQKFVDAITVTKTGSIGLPKHFYNLHKINQFKYITLFFDKSQKALGIKFSNDDSEKKSSFKINPSEHGYGANIIARSFFKTYNLDTLLYYGKYPYEIDESNAEIGNLYVIKLKEKNQEENVYETEEIPADPSVKQDVAVG
ncbi:hypothetical protein A3B50_00720 [Candidatus Roizmanbacteria bacterium RIFCSPLOWO2_01_FULL_40_42]|uniref:Uncharacterized protein n=1 Tax=Candidatus Roizmanbacteria bacterium RIFCSPLOWO2_01_FULL_40_42 TaxID=1802066 RepID=A0A1F7J4X9_9BACT|nr:MAG: hypothetical protein A3C31_02265 [Candidatus Roizmanbacteria bacterium RIFCSPHIGHO2_02_FULL_40_53]OGK36313.1 MAG: hypothetical protein A3E69_03710 [Candidatus Roizmanbacteria bacterium RIFCSPHIGHO2_12_FULL_40_130]OGK50685.1 MAG: hypothetical protein A3B50_00720 [Candidatus Roizmanbacteria bacterium RIFCSPLOWO2_01_FULL_40_42]OGK59214.1 MAG: hypothetical protein A3H84_03565 [Candidatus Roizmanbacteria bacterium RIFCSPLOWO2_02_FULL_40_13]